MKSNGGSRHIRFALIIFVGLVIFSLAQLTWWIIFQVGVNKQIYNYRIVGLHERIDLLALQINNEFSQLARLADQTLSRTESGSPDVRRYLEGLLTDPAIVGASGNFGNSGQFDSLGRVDSTFYYRTDFGPVIYFDPEYVREAAAGHSDQLTFAADGKYHNGEDSRWITSGMISISPWMLDWLSGEAHRGIH